MSDSLEVTGLVIGKVGRKVWVFFSRNVGREEIFFGRRVFVVVVEARFLGSRSFIVWFVVIFC